MEMFVRVVEHGALSAAARSLRMTQMRQRREQD